MVKNCRLFVQCLRLNLTIINFVTKGYNDKLRNAIQTINITIHVTNYVSLLMLNILKLLYK